ncbi:MAG: O-antigen ligase family protein [Syntrophorhabdaceae bacterium]
MALITTIALFGFQLIGSLADYLGMETRGFSLLLRFGSGLVFFISAFFLIVNHRILKRNLLLECLTVIGICFLVYYGINLLYKTHFPQFSLSKPWFEYIGYLIFFNFLPFIALSFVKKEKYFFYLYYFLLINNTLFLCVYLSFYGEDAFRGMRYQPFESVNPIGVGYAALLAATLASWKLINAKLNLVNIIIHVPIVTAGIILALLSGQRQVLLSLLVTIYLLIQRRLKPIGGRNWFVGAAIFTLVCGLLFYTMSNSEIFNNIFIRVSDTEHRIGGGEEIRILGWIEALNIFLENPITGGHIELPSYAIYPHNLLLEAFMSMGLLGGAWLSCFFIMVLWQGFCSVSSRYGWVGLFHIQVALSALFSGALYSNECYWISAGMLLGLGRVNNQTEVVKSGTGRRNIPNIYTQRCSEK